MFTGFACYMQNTNPKSDYSPMIVLGMVFDLFTLGMIFAK